MDEEEDYGYEYVAHVPKKRQEEGSEVKPKEKPADNPKPKPESSQISTS
jgi:hypothetical protein